MEFKRRAALVTGALVLGTVTRHKPHRLTRPGSKVFCYFLCPVGWERRGEIDDFSRLRYLKVQTRGGELGSKVSIPVTQCPLVSKGNLTVPRNSSPQLDLVWTKQEISESVKRSRYDTFSLLAPQGGWPRYKNVNHNTVLNPFKFEM